jgi:hypothetical protein
VIFLIISGFVFGQNTDRIFNIQNLIACDSITGSNYFEYEAAMSHYSETNKDSAIFLIKMGLLKEGGPAVYSFLAFPVFYPFSDNEYFEMLAYADSILNIAIPDEYLPLINLIRPLYIDDQKYRKKMSEMVSSPNFFADSLNRIRFGEVAKEMNAADIQNIIVFDSLLDVYGKKLFELHEIDPMSHKAVTLMLLHADKKPELQYKCVSKYKKAVIDNCGAEFYAVLYDRYLSNIKENPKYFMYNPERIEPENLKKVNKDRKKIGLEPYIISEN